MPFTFQGQPIQRARVTVPRLFVGEGEVTVAGQLDVAVGASVALVLGDTSFAGFVVAGGTFEGAVESTYSIGLGAAGWAKTVGPKAFQAPAGVKLSQVVPWLAAAAGERFELGGLDRTLGDHWTIPVGPASVAASALFAEGWRVDPDGVGRPGPRPPAPLPAGLDLAVETFPAAQRRATVGLPGDEVSALLPGAILTAPNLATPIVVGETTIRATSDSVTVEVLGEAGLVELFAALVVALTPRSLAGLYRYQVADADSGALNLKALDPRPGLPAILACAKVYGLPGVTATLAPNDVVVLGFLDGSPARPAAVAYLGAVSPLTVALAAQTEIDAVAPAVRLGATSGGGPAVIDQLGSFATWVAAVSAATHVTPPPPFDATKVFGV